MNELINDEGDCRTAPATPGLLNSLTMHITTEWSNVYLLGVVSRLKIKLLLKSSLKGCN